jgi:hypothetical protein
VPPTIPLPEAYFLQIENAATWLCPADRDAFCAQVAAELAGHEIGSGLVGRAISQAFRRFYRPLPPPEPTGVRVRKSYKATG